MLDAVLLLLAGGLALYHQARRAATLSAMDTLETTVRLRAHALNQWLAERNADAEVVAGNPLLVQALRRLLARGPGASGAAADALHAELTWETSEGAAVQAHLDDVRHRYGYHGISLVDTLRGRVLAGSGSPLSPIDLGHLPLDASGLPRWFPLASGSDGLFRGAMVQRIVVNGRPSPGAGAAAGPAAAAGNPARSHTLRRARRQQPAAAPPAG